MLKRFRVRTKSRNDFGNSYGGQTAKRVRFVALPSGESEKSSVKLGLLVISSAVKPRAELILDLRWAIALFSPGSRTRELFDGQGES